MKLYVAAMLGGAFGSALRYGLSLWVDARTMSAFPWGTLTVNVLGSFLIGLCVAAMTPNEHGTISPAWYTFLVIGVLGGFTTFSSFSFQTVHLLQTGHWDWALANVLLSILLCLGATALAFALIPFLPFKS